jgi:hypothetical protein
MMFKPLDRRRLLGLAGAAVFAAFHAQAETCQIAVSFTYNHWSRLHPWGEQLRGKISAWWPAISRALGDGVCASGKTIDIAFARLSPASVAAEAEGDRIIVNAPYVLANLGNADMFRMIAHELAHVAQAYPGWARPRWMTEGIADYVRYYILFPNDPGRPFDPSREDWREGYAPAAGLIDFAERGWPGSLARVNAAMRSGADGEAVLAESTGLSMAALWARYLATNPADASPAKRRAYARSLKHAS